MDTYYTFYSNRFTYVRMSCTRKASETGGVPVFSIGGRMVDRRQRLLGMTDEERRWRAQYLKDQKLDPDEPRFSPELFRATNNIFRRMSKYPLDMLKKVLVPAVGEKAAFLIRQQTRSLLLAFAASCLVAYHFKYNLQDWTRTGGWYVISSRRPLLPGDPDYPNVPELKPYEYCDLGFSKTFFFEELYKK